MLSSGGSRNFGEKNGDGRQCISLVVNYRKCTQRTTGWPKKESRYDYSSL